MKTSWTWVTRLAGVLFCAAMAFCMAYMLVDLAQRFARPAAPIEADRFAAAVVGLALLIFVGLLVAFSSEAAKPTVSERAANDLPPSAHLGVTCPTCHSAMTLQGEYTRPATAEAGVYIWTCERSHWWRRVGVNAADATFPWRVLSAAPNGDSASPKVHFG